MKNKLFFSLLSVLVISALTFGVTYAYYVASNSDEFNGEVQSSVNTVLTLSTTYKASRLVPLKDSLVATAISKDTNKCIDKKNYEVCSLYTITLNNTNASETLYGYIKTTNSNYTTNNLKYQVFDSSYNAISDVMTLSNIVDTPVYFQKSSNNYSITSNGTITYYLAIWLTDTGFEQSADYSKDFSGVLGFELLEYYGTGNGRIEASFET